MADIFSLIDEYKELLDKKDELKEATTDNNKALEAKRKELAQAMIDAESPKVSRGGFLYSLQDKTKYNKIGDCDEDAFFDTLEEHGLGDIIKPYQYYDVAKRKETNKAAKNAKKKKEA